MKTKSSNDTIQELSLPWPLCCVSKRLNHFKVVRTVTLPLNGSEVEGVYSCQVNAPCLHQNNLIYTKKAD